MKNSKKFIIKLIAIIIFTSGFLGLAKISTAAAPRPPLTSFEAIADINAGEAGSALYNNASEVIAVLPTTVMANTDTVPLISIPVGTWVDTDLYNPSVEGSYTFTSSGETISFEYSNSNNIHATVEVIISHATPIVPPVVKKHTTSGSSPMVMATFKAEQEARAKSIGLYTSDISGQTSNSVSVKRILKQGMAGDDVKDLQIFLNKNGFIVSVSGLGSIGNETNYFGPKTRAAVILFQKSHGLTEDGIVGEKTLKYYIAIPKN